MRIDRKKLVTAMIDSDMNGIKLAEKSGLSAITISSIKNGRSCSDETAGKLAKALNVSIDDLRENRGE